MKYLHFREKNTVYSRSPIRYVYFKNMTEQSERHVSKAKASSFRTSPDWSLPYCLSRNSRCLNTDDFLELSKFSASITLHATAKLPARTFQFPPIYRAARELITLSPYLYEHREIDDRDRGGDEHRLQGHVPRVDQQDQSKRNSAS